MSFRSLHTRCGECRQVMKVHTDNPDVVYCGCEGFEAPRCGVKCAHEDDVHDCKKCAPLMAFACEPLCQVCPTKGHDTCHCPEVGQ